MGGSNHSCPSCEGSTFWGGVANAVRRMFGIRPKKGEVLRHVPVDSIRDNPYQPRKYVLAEPHDDLKMSISQYGVIVPIIVSRMVGGGYTLVAGQRRLEASRELGLETIPAIVRSLDQKEMMEVSYLENLHREDLSQVDVVQMFDRLHRKYPDLEEEELAVVMGLDREQLHKARELLDLPVPALEALRAGMINEWQAQAVSEIKDPDLMLEAVEVIYRDKLDEEHVKALVARMMGRPAPFVSTEESPHYHHPSCPFAYGIPQRERRGYYTRTEAKKRGKIPCMNCL